MIEPDEVWWNAIRDRDAAFDGALFYGVLTTGVYCRPGCPSRRPKRENVRFFPDAASAQRAGLRACKRCRPDTAATTGDGATRLVVGACDRLSNQDPLPTPSAFATLSGCSDRTLRRAFKDVLGITPGQYLQALKTQRLRGALRNGERITDALYSAGYGSSGRAYENTARLGMRPSTLYGRWRRRPDRICAARDCCRLAAGGGVCERLVLRAVWRVAGSVAFDVGRRVSGRVVDRNAQRVD